MYDNKTDFASLLSHQFLTSSNWRTSQAKRFKHDDRNADASQRLLDLASKIHISDDAWTRLAPLVQDHAACMSAVSEANRLVGFKERPADFAGWLETFCTILTRH
ncbi:hypothetical protein QCM80_30125 [Bradyrhizobium sp. SSUT112]|uniref:hypothetical protein n=1 Tax=Bradyrhizobium sp. SSUT112 TaxID=3040604 RepID=UPI00244A3806|nr:hypothetical protein [Bradyrhizobium sp. SSUT112]MDH2354893.1 hypothetical protein [Bradyrhizobium sp. SSUT112]